MIKVTQLAHQLVARVLREGAVAVDATAGNGRDTLFLARMVGPGGHVYAFDIQEEALRRTAAALARENLDGRVTLIHAGHEYLSEYVKPPVSAVMFNLGYLPGGDHGIVTRRETTVPGLKAALALLSPGGLAALVLYPGHREGKAERGELLDYCRRLVPKEYAVVRILLPNQTNNPPESMIIYKH